MRRGNNVGVRALRHSAIAKPTNAINGADHAKIAISTKNARNSFGAVFTKTSALKKLVLTAGHPGAIGMSIAKTTKTANVLRLAIVIAFRRCCASYTCWRDIIWVYLTTGTPVASCIHSASIAARVPSVLRLFTAASTQAFRALPSCINSPN